MQAHARPITAGRVLCVVTVTDRDLVSPYGFVRIKMLIMGAVLAIAAGGTGACATGPAKSCWPVACPTDTSTPDGGAAGRGPKDNRPPNRPAGPTPVVDDGWVTFFAEVLDAAGVAVPDTESGTITAAGLDADYQLVNDWTNADTGQPGVPVEMNASFPAAISIQPGPTTYLLSFTASAFLPTGWYLYCHVRRGKITKTQGNTVNGPPLSDRKSLPAGPGLGASSVFCTYPDLPNGVEPPPIGG